MGNGLISNTLIVIIVVAVVIVSVALGASGFFKDKVYPFIDNIDFTPDNATVEWLGDINLTYPGEIIYYIYGNDAEIYLWFDDKSVIVYDEGSEVPVGWKYSQTNDALVDSGYFLSMNNQDALKKLGKKNMDFLNSLEEKTPEEGLEIILNRVIKNDEGNTNWLWIEAMRIDVELRVFIGGWKSFPPDYESSDKRLRNIEGLIDKFNQISRGVVVARGD
jgi:hypothetical protein